ncbi:MAG: LacI family transcriptional regulator [Hungatella sp.]|nr:LacI family transcriptional regulator [Hungatella sp.]
MATRKDVAKLAGVSTATVSYFINDSGYVSQEKRQRIAKAIEELDYQPNLIAKSLKVKDTKQIVFLCNEICNPFHARVAYRATTEAYCRDYMILFCNVIDDEKYIARLCSYQVSGVFIASNRLPLEAIKKMTARRIPVVMLDERLDPEIPEEVSRIIIDYSQIMRDVVRHMLSSGKRELFYLSSNPAGHMGINDGKTSAVVEAAKAEKGCTGLTVERGMVSALDAYHMIMEKYGSRLGKNTGFICTNDDTALGVMRAVNDLGLRIPEDAAVIGTGNTYLSEMSVPRLSTLDIQTDYISQKAIQILADKNCRKEVQNIWIQPRMIRRETS